MLQNLSPQQASDLLLALNVTHTAETVPLFSCRGRVLAGDITAAMDVPPFARSPYDGFALRAADTVGACLERPVTLALTGALPAGSAPAAPLSPGKAVRILTGAPVPAGCDCVVKQEHPAFTETSVTLTAPLLPGDIVPAGEDVKAGTLLARAGTRLTPALSGVLAGQGMAAVPVFRAPSAAVFSTGSELVRGGNPLSPGQIYDSNFCTVGGLLAEMGCAVTDCGTVRDDAPLLAEALKAACSQYDLVVTTGGASVGDHDYTHRAIELAGGEVLFHKLSFKPGGAMLAGILNGKVILGLSGSPGAAAVGLLRVCRPYILKLCGRSDADLTPISLPLKSPLKKASPQTRLLRGKIVFEGGRALFEETPGRTNGSALSMVGCEALAEIPAGSPPLPEETMVVVHRVSE